MEVHSLSVFISYLFIHLNIVSVRGTVEQLDKTSFDDFIGKNELAIILFSKYLVCKHRLYLPISGSATQLLPHTCQETIDSDSLSIQNKINIKNAKIMQ